MKHQRLLMVLLFIAISGPAWAEWDNHHFYRASYFFNEPRLEKSGLTTLQGSIAFGATNRSRNSQGNTVPLFDLYGTSNMQFLGAGVPEKNPSNPADLALINLARVPNTDCRFANFSIGGEFKILEGYIDYYQNLAGGFFLQVDIPVRSLGLHCYKLKDISPSSPNVYPNINTEQWQEFLTNFDAILGQYHLSLEQVKKSGIGDVTFLLGWTTNWQKTEVLDFIDCTVQAGVLAPTAKGKNPDVIFDLPLGYDKHLGVPVSVDLSMGLYSWLTAGIHAGVIPFVSRCQDVRIKTDLNQSGIIKLAKVRGNVDLGPLWDLGAFVKLDHLARGLSILVGYTFVLKEDDKVCPGSYIVTEPDCSVRLVDVGFDPIVVNSDPMLKGWAMNTIHLTVEYDFTNEDSWYGPRLAFIYNAEVGGRRTFNTSMTGGYFGLDIAWCL